MFVIKVSATIASASSRTQQTDAHQILYALVNPKFKSNLFRCVADFDSIWFAECNICNLEVIISQTLASNWYHV